MWRSAPRGGAPDGPDDGLPGPIEVLIVHRPHRRDWSFPKGKAEPGEADDACALREVAEETGLRCRLGPDLGTVDYVDAKGRPKTVHWWAMTAALIAADGSGPGGADALGPEDDEEVDELAWLSPRDAATALSYDTDREVLDRFRRAVPTPSP